MKNRRGGRFISCSVMVGAVALALPASVLAIPLNLGENIRGNFDTTVSWGSSIRVGDRDDAIIGTANGGTAHSVNGDTGNLNYDSGDFVSNTLKASHELLLQADRWSVFGRGFYFRDFQTMDWAEPNHVPFTNAAKNEIGAEFKLLDAYLALDFDLGGSYLTIKGGNQALNWGESTFIQNGINSMSTIDVAKLRVAGSEIKEALEAIPMIQASLNLSNRFTVEGFYPFIWRHTEIEPSGTFFSTNDFAGPGGNRVLLGFGVPGISDTTDNAGVGAPVGVNVARAEDRDAKDGGEFGFVLRWFEPKLNDTEFGFYFTNLHSRLPLLSGFTGLRQEGLGAGDYASTANYFREFPEDIKTVGLSFNTQLPPRLGVLSGVAIQGEVSMKMDQPLQADDVELLFAALSPIDEFVGFPEDDDGFSRSQLVDNENPFGFDEYVRGWRRKDVIQAQASFTKLMGPRFGADQWTFLSEVGATIVQDMEDPSVLRYEAAGTYTSADEWFADNVSPASGNPLMPEAENPDAFADDFSWGYRVVTRAEYNNFIGPITLTPTLVWFHDVSGTTPSPIVNFIDKRKTITAALAATYLINWRATLVYTNSFGGDRWNLLTDRDFVAFTLSYSF